MIIHTKRHFNQFPLKTPENPPENCVTQSKVKKSEEKIAR